MMIYTTKRANVVPDLKDANFTLQVQLSLDDISWESGGTLMFVWAGTFRGWRCYMIIQASRCLIRRKRFEIQYRVIRLNTTGMLEPFEIENKYYI